MLRTAFNPIIDRFAGSMPVEDLGGKAVIGTHDVVIANVKVLQSNRFQYLDVVTVRELREAVEYYGATVFQFSWLNDGVGILCTSTPVELSHASPAVRFQTRDLQLRHREVVFDQAGKKSSELWYWQDSLSVPTGMGRYLKMQYPRM